MSSSGRSFNLLRDRQGRGLSPLQWKTALLSLKSCLNTGRKLLSGIHYSLRHINAVVAASGAYPGSVIKEKPASAAEIENITSRDEYGFCPRGPA